MISRRSVLTMGGLGTLGTALPGCRGGLGLKRLPLVAGATSDVALAGVPRYGGPSVEHTMAATQAAALAATDFGWLSRGDSVLLKVACNSGNAYPATTDPSALRGMIALLKAKGAGRVVVADMSGVQSLRFTKDSRSGSTLALMKNSGMAGAVKEAGGEVYAFEDAGWDAFHEEIPATGKYWPGGIMMPNLVREVDHIILMPRCSRHLLVGSTLGFKAAVGWWRHDSRLAYHHGAGSLHEKTAEANTVPSLLQKQRLVLTSATRVLVSFGPDRGHVHVPETGLIIASPSLLAHDMVSMNWLLQNRAMVPARRLEGLRDPYRSEYAVDMGNRVLCKWLGGVGKFVGAQQLLRHDIASIFDDRVLHRAMQIHGGTPRIALAAANTEVPPGLLRRLEAALAPDAYR